MGKYINKADVMAELEKLYNLEYNDESNLSCGKKIMLRNILRFLNTLKVIDPYEQCIQYDSIKAGIQAHAETYSFNIESELFNQLTKEQQELWRKEIEQACISGGNAGVELARDIRYKENVEVKEVDFETEWKKYFEYKDNLTIVNVKDFAKHFFELGMQQLKNDNDDEEKK